MKKMTRLLLSSMFVVLTAMTACSNSSSAMPLSAQGIDLPAAHVNGDIQISPAPDSAAAFEQIGIFYCQIQNMTDTRIVFPPDYGLRVFLKVDETWEEVQVAVPENIDLSGAEQVLLPQAQKPGGNYYPVKPILPEGHSRPFTLRLVVLGSMGEGLGKQQVAAYTDVKFP